MRRNCLARSAALAAISLATPVSADRLHSGSPVVAACQAPGSSLESAGFLERDRKMIRAQASDAATHPYAGLWVTPDGHIRHALLPNGRYDEARGTRESAYRGRYEVTGNRIEYWDDTGFTADGVFVSPDILHHAGMIFHRRK
jgi:hypothetical protein